MSKAQKDEFFSMIRDKIVSIANEQRDYFQKYYKSLLPESIPALIGLCDVGWHGTIQNSLQEISRANTFHGYYLGTSDDCKVLCRDFISEVDSTLKKYVLTTTDFVELMFLSTEGTTLSYNEMSGELNGYIQGDSEYYKETTDKIERMQSQALRFIREYKSIEQSFGDDCLSIYISPYAEFVRTISMKSLSEILNMRFTHKNREHLFRRRRLAWYLAHPNGFIEDMKDTGCKAFFLKSVFRIPLPYTDIVMILKKHAR